MSIILYTINCTWRGHLNRSLKFIDELIRRGHEVYILLSWNNNIDSIQQELKNVIHRTKWFTFEKKNWVISISKSIQPWAKRALSFKKGLSRCLDACKWHKFDLVISDFEPYGPSIAKKIWVSSLHLSHQAAMFWKNTPQPFLRNLPVELMCKSYCLTDYTLWLHYDTYNDNTLAPLIKPEFLEMKEGLADHGHTVIYLWWVVSDEELIHIAQQDSSNTYHIYSKWFKERKINGNIIQCPISTVDFLESCRTANAIISSWGFNLTWEAMSIEKALYAIPQPWQYEQILNVLALKKLGIYTTKKFTLKNLQHFQRNKKAIWLPNWYTTPEDVVDIIEKKYLTPKS